MSNMISIVTAYFNRKELFINTLKSIRNQNSPFLLEVIAVDDGSDEDERLEDLVQEFPFLIVIRLERQNKWYSNSCVPFNIGFNAAKGDKVIIQNPECVHFGTILKYVNFNLTENNYLSFGCYSLDKKVTSNIDFYLNDNKIENIIKKNNHIVKKDGELGWYNHSIFRPVAFHFCTAISKKALKKLKGFDERFALGIGFDDNEFIERVKKKLTIIFIDSEIVLHQNHYSTDSKSFENRENRDFLIRRNAHILYNRQQRVNYNTLLFHLSGKTKKEVIKIILKFENAIIFFKKLFSILIKRFY